MSTLKLIVNWNSERWWEHTLDGVSGEGLWGEQGSGEQVEAALPAMQVQGLEKMCARSPGRTQYICGAQELIDTKVIILCFLLLSALGWVWSPLDGAILLSSKILTHLPGCMLALAVESPPLGHSLSRERLPWKRDDIMGREQVWGSARISNIKTDERGLA